MLGVLLAYWLGRQVGQAQSDMTVSGAFAQLARDIQFEKEMRMIYGDDWDDC